MHTSYGNQILISDTPEETSRKVMHMYTDPTRIHPNDPGHVEGNPVFTYLDAFDPDPSGLAEMKHQYRAGRIGDVAVKHHLVVVLNTALDPIRQRRTALMTHPERITEIIRAGTERARPIAQANLEETMDHMGLTLLNGVTATNPGGGLLPLIGTFC
jgi:tryptophanyl-tRNA synthetase